MGLCHGSAQVNKSVSELEALKLDYRKHTLPCLAEF